MASQEVIDLFNNGNFKLVLPTPPPCRSSASEVRIASRKFSFSAMTAAEIGYPEYACLFVSDDASKLVVKGCQATEYSFPFSIKDLNGKMSKKAITTGNLALSQVIRSKLGWDQKSCYVCPGILYRDEQLVLFDLTQAYIRNYSKPEKAIPQKVFDSYPPLYEVMRYKPVLIPAAAGKTPVTDVIL